MKLTFDLVSSEFCNLHGFSIYMLVPWITETPLNFMGLKKGAESNLCSSKKPVTLGKGGFQKSHSLAPL